MPFTFLYKPQAADVFQVANPAVDADFISKIIGIGMIVDNWLFEIQAHQWPGAATKVGWRDSLARHCCYGTSSIMTGNRDDFHTVQSCVFWHMGTQCA